MTLLNKTENRLNILVLGVGGNVSLGIIKALKKTSLNTRIIGACVTNNAVGFYFCEKVYLSPYANNSEFVPWLIDVCNKECVDVVLTGVEEILLAMSDDIDNIKNNTDSDFILSDLDTLRIGQDKLETVKWLKSNGFNYPKFAKLSDSNNVKKLIDGVGFPLIIKPIIGKSSKGIYKVRNLDELNSFSKDGNQIIQEYIASEDDEYTVGCYRSQKGKIYTPIIMHRYLKNGSTVKAEIVKNSNIEREAYSICESLKPLGPLNIQMRLKKDQPICFELNIRFSGTTPIRAHFGFRDIEACIYENCLKEDKLESFFNYRYGRAERYENEIYIEEDNSFVIEKF